ncbi:MAG: Amuc_1100 family pilus-like protein [Kiritimatiellae bacterium]|nr:Amuc_1100 family pilus-like protein [Kiritimatiellia bacterium]
MNVKPHLGIIVAGSLGLVVLGVAAFLLFTFYGKYAQVEGDLNRQMDRFNGLVQRNPYPSPSNVELAQKNYEELRNYANRLREALQQGQIEPEQMERADFPPLAERTLRGLWEDAERSKVTFPTGFAFGFQRYIAGELPEPANIPRLVVQLKTVDALCRLLFKAKISSLTDIVRDEFDKDGAAAEEEEEDSRSRRRRDRSAPEEKKKTVVAGAGEDSDLYSVERITLSFTCRENAVWDLLNEMVKSPLFVVVTSLEFQSPLPKVDKISFAQFQENKIRAAAGQRLAPSQQEKIRQIREDKVYAPPSREERVVAGREEINVILKCEVYRFRTDGLEAETT